MDNNLNHLDYATPPGDPRMKRVYRAADTLQAEFVRGLLENEGVPAVVHGANVDIWLGPLMGAAVAPGVYVREDDLTAAEEIVRRYRAGEIDIGKPWICPKCAEQIEGQFTACWNCGATPDGNGKPNPVIPLDDESLDDRRKEPPDALGDNRDDEQGDR